MLKFPTLSRIKRKRRNGVTKKRAKEISYPTDFGIHFDVNIDDFGLILLLDLLCCP